MRLRVLTGALVLLLAACGLEIPRAVQVSSSFGLHVPVGDIGEMDEVKEMLEYTKTEKITSLFSSDGPDAVKITAYYYTANGYVIPLPDSTDSNKNMENLSDATNAINPSEVRSMFLHFPLTSMNLDLTEYLKSVEIPPVVMPDASEYVQGGKLPEGYTLSEPYDFETMTVKLDAMSEWIESVELDTSSGNTTTVTVKGGKALQAMLQMAVPKLGIGDSETDFKSGVEDGEDLVFSAKEGGEKKLEPETAKSVEIYLRLIKVPPSGGPYMVEIDLKWKEAKVNPGESGVYEGKVPLPFGEFSEFSEKHHIASLPCYLYVGGPFDGESDVGLKLKVGDNDWLVGGENEEEKITQDLSFSKAYPADLFDADGYNESLHESTASFNLAAKMNASEGDLELDYQLRVNNWEVHPDDETLSVISADMVVILPLQFELNDPEAKETIEIGGETKTFVKLESMADYGSNGSDLLGRDQEGVPSGIFTDIRFSGDNIKDTLFGGKLFLRIFQEGEVDEMEQIKPGSGFSFNIDSPPMPFHPEFGLYMETSEDTPVIKVAPKPKEGDDAFALRLSVDVTGMVEYEQNL
ncbi:MAG: hypothetical protein LBK61_12930 [Spirochaetaceae bacterium]|jgi:hypothetical protein|nr:hypothetical protein [Spirochaetaceae bacterium]